jgi:type IV secretion system protein VirD4
MTVRVHGALPGGVLTVLRAMPGIWGLAIYMGAVMAVITAVSVIRRRRRASRQPASHLVRRVRWRLPPGPGFTRGRWALRHRHGLPAARRTAGRTRPSLGWAARRFGDWCQYATFVGWAHGWFAPVRVYAGFEQLHLAIAPARTGKSAAAAGRILDAPGPVVATSIRGDLIEATAGLRQRLGEVHVFNPEGAGPFRSTLSWDPVAGCQDMAAAVRRAGYMVEAATAGGLEDASFWHDQASMVLAAFLHAAGLAGASMREVYRWVLDGGTAALGIVSRHPWAAETAAAHLGHYRALPDRTQAGISTTLLGVLRFLQVSEAAGVVCPTPGTGFDIPAFLRSAGTLYLVAADAAHSPVPPLFATLIAEIAYQAKLMAAASPAGRLDPPLTLELDEVANIAPIPAAAWATWAAGCGIRMHLYAQSYAQLADRWGQTGAETLWQTCDLKIVYAGGSEEALCRKVEDACGQVQVPTQTPARKPGQASWQWESRPAMPFAAVRQLPQGRAVVIRSGAEPVIVRTERYWRRSDVRRFRRRGGRPVLPAPLTRPLPDPMPGLLAPSPALPLPSHPLPGTAASPPLQP